MSMIDGLQAEFDAYNILKVDKIVGQGLSENNFTNDLILKLQSIEKLATADQTGNEIKSLYEAEPNTNGFTDAEKTKLAGLEAPHFKGQFPNITALRTTIPVGIEGNYAYVDAGIGSDVESYIWDNTDNEWILQQGKSTAETAASIKIKYESNADTNAFTDASQAKVNFISVSAIINLDTIKSDTTANSLLRTGGDFGSVNIKTGGSISEGGILLSNKYYHSGNFNKSDVDFVANYVTSKGIYVGGSSGLTFTERSGGPIKKWDMILGGAGDDFVVNRFSNTGAYIGQGFNINRVTGKFSTGDFDANNGVFSGKITAAIIIPNLLAIKDPSGNSYNIKTSGSTLQFLNNSDQVKASIDFSGNAAFLGNVTLDNELTGKGIGAASGDVLFKLRAWNRNQGLPVANISFELPNIATPSNYADISFNAWNGFNNMQERLRLHRDGATFSGDVTSKGTVFSQSWQGTSDRRAKKNIIYLSPKKLNTRYASFNFIEGDTKMRHVSPIAQDMLLDNDLKTFVSGSEKDTYKVAIIDLHSEEIAYLKYQVALLTQQLGIK